MRYILIFIFFTSLTWDSQAQELFCKIVVNGDQVQTQDKVIFRDMEQAFTRFMNEQKWTDNTYEPFERIKCNLLITVQSMPSIGNFRATAQIVSSRPVYNSSYESVMLNYADRDWVFNYTEGRPIIFNESGSNDNLTALLAFYAYIIIGLDRDSFELNAGAPFYQTAQEIVNFSQGSELPGWQPYDSNRNRYWLLENLTNNIFLNVREGIYRYHRLGLDRMISEPQEARQEVMMILEELKKANDLRPNAELTISFFDAKSDEIVGIFQEGQPALKRQAYNLLVELNPKNTEKYKTIL
ncbi:MAG TPA: DUF4835 domain-containing protein [Cytophagales bacterium]|jgi:hypothetical protein|nr:DUF4835 domain-containing protein [Cytophagales bacterium]